MPQIALQFTVENWQKVGWLDKSDETKSLDLIRQGSVWLNSTKLLSLTGKCWSGKTSKSE